MADTITTAGLITSFDNTPQANPDEYYYTEDSSSYIWLDVMSNDLGGKAKTLYSLDADVGDLLQKDVAGVAEFSALGAKISIGTDSDGKVKIKYEPNGVFDSLADGETTTDTFYYAIRLANGALSWDTVTITVTGTNDGPILADTSDPAAVSEAADASAQDLAAINGSFSVTDLDVGDTLTPSVVGSPEVLLNGSAFALPAGAAALTAAGAFALTGAISNGGAVNIGYTYNPGAANLDFLRAGESLTITYTVKVNDGFADSGTQDVTFTITGTNDAPILSDTSDPAAVLELGDASAQDLTAINGSFSVSDLDVGDTLMPSVVGSPEVLLNGSAFVLPAGAAALTAAGAFSLTGAVSDGDAVNIDYSWDPGAANLDFLKAGDSLTITYTVKVNDGTADSANQNVTFTITGTNDAPVFSDTSDPAAVLELGDASAQDLTAINGSFSVTDLDVGDALAPSVVGSPVVKLNDVAFALPAGAASLITAGAFSLTGAVSDGGAVNIDYSWDPGAANLDFLKAGDSLTITYTVKVNDGIADSSNQDVTFTITGTNDAPIARDDSYEADEDLTLTADNAGGNPAGLLDHLDGAETTDDTDVDGDDLDIAAVKVGGTEIVDGGIGDEDGDDDGTITFKTSHSLVTLDVETGTFDYAPDANFNGSDGFDYKATDGVLTSDWASVDITVNSVNDAPEGTDKTVSMNEDGAYTFSAADFGFTDPSDTPPNNLQAVIITSLPGNGTLLLAGVPVVMSDLPLTILAADLGDLTFEPDDNENGAPYTSFEFKVQDDGGGDDIDPVANTITIDVTAVNDAPAIDVDGAATYTTGGPAVAIDSTIAITDIDSTTLTGAVISITGNFQVGDVLNFTDQAGITGSYVGGVLTLSGPASLADYEMAIESITFSTSSSSTLTRTISYKVNDGTDDSATDTATVSVVIGNEAPTDIKLISVAAADVDVTVNTISTVNFVTLGSLITTDPDVGDTFTYSVSGTDAARFAIFGNELRLVDDLANGGSYDFTIRTTDGGGLFYEEGFHVLVGNPGKDASLGDPGAIDGNDIIFGLAQADTIFGLSGDDELYGQAGNDTLNGGDGEDQLFGGDGSDSLNGGAGNDTLVGGTGADTYNLTGGGNDHIIISGTLDGTDVVSGFSASGVEQDFVDLDQLFDSLSIASGAARDARVDITASGSNTLVKIDIGGNGLFNDANDLLITLNSVAASDVSKGTGATDDIQLGTLL